MPPPAFLGRPVGLVIFDCDGVLVDTEPTTLRVMREWIATFGLELPMDEVVATIKGVHIDTIEAMITERVGRELPDFVAGYRRNMFEAFERGIPPIEGAVAALDALDRIGLPWCVASNGPHTKMDASLGSSGLSARTPRDRIFSADDVENPKPAPDLFLFAAHECGFGPDHCVVVEDSPAGVVAARAAGMRVLAHVDLTPRSELAKAEPDAIVESMAELPGLLSL
ncbi:MAG: HAD-IA family hydrolase [Planctomycetota bacterium]